MTSAPDGGTTAPTRVRLLARAFVQFVLSAAIWGGLLFGAAGRLDWTRAWIHIGVWVVTLAINGAVLLALNPAILEHRTRRRKIEQPFDKAFMAFFVPLALSLPVVVGLDVVRFQWSSLPLWTLYPAIVLHVLGDVLIVWAMLVNPFGEKTVRIQEERSHRVISTGPYRHVRHPMYAANVMLLTAIPLMLGSPWGFLIAGLMVLLLVARTVFEDRFLRRELPGYAAYAAETRHRLVPGVW